MKLCWSEKNVRKNVRKKYVHPNAKINYIDQSHLRCCHADLLPCLWLCWSRFYLKLSTQQQQRNRSPSRARTSSCFSLIKRGRPCTFPRAGRRPTCRLTRLKKNGLSFNLTRTNACMCTAARATLFTGLMPAQHGSRYVLEEAMPANIYSQVTSR